MKKIHKNLMFVLVGFLVCLIFAPNFVFSADASAGYPSANVLNRLPTRDLPTFVGSAIKVLLGLIGSVALVMFSYAGLMWMVSMDGEKKKKALDTLIWSSLGIITILASYAVVSFVFNMIK